MHQIKDNMTGALHTKYQSEAIRIQNLNVGKPTIKLVKNEINYGRFQRWVHKDPKAALQTFHILLSIDNYMAHIKLGVLKNEMCYKKGRVRIRDSTVYKVCIN